MPMESAHREERRYWSAMATKLNDAFEQLSANEFSVDHRPFAVTVSRDDAYDISIDPKYPAAVDKLSRIERVLDVLRVAAERTPYVARPLNVGQSSLPVG
jgi:hypothetical protein